MEIARNSEGPCRPDVSCAVLAGGRSRRIGADKAFLQVGGKPLLAWTLDALAGVCPETIIIADDVERYAQFGLPVYPDIIPRRGALGGLYTALVRAPRDRVLVVACDMPFLNRALLRYMMDLASGYDAVVPRLPQGVEPLHAVYAQKCADAILPALERGERRIISFFPQIDVRYLEAVEIAALDPDFRSFFNVNTPADLEAIHRILETAGT